jgi:hypothetical protein
MLRLADCNGRPSGMCEQRRSASRRRAQRASIKLRSSIRPPSCTAFAGSPRKAPCSDLCCGEVALALVAGVEGDTATIDLPFPRMRARQRQARTAETFPSRDERRSSNKRTRSVRSARRVHARSMSRAYRGRSRRRQARSVPSPASCSRIRGKRISARARWSTIPSHR